MSVFNPNPQQVQEEDFRNYSRPITPFEGSKAAATALSGVGQGLAHTGEFIKDVGKVQEFSTRQDIANSPELASANATREQVTAGYENYVLTQSQAKEINQSNTSLDLM